MWFTLDAYSIFAYIFRKNVSCNARLNYILIHMLLAASSDISQRSKIWIVLHAKFLNSFHTTTIYEYFYKKKSNFSYLETRCSLVHYF